MRKLLVVGGSGAIGSEVVALFGRLPDWQVFALCRSAPVLDADVNFVHLAVNLEDAAECDAAVAKLGISHVIYAALLEAPGLTLGWTDVDTMQRNLAMLRNIIEPIAHAGHLEHVIAMQGTKAYGAHLHAISLPARESTPRDPHANFYWLQEDYLRELGARVGLTWTLLRPQIVFSGALGVNMNPISVIAAYAVLCAEAGLPCGYPGSGDTIWEATDARLIARACAWAFEHTTREERIYNVTNGDVWVIPHQWPTLCALLDVDVGPDRRFDFATMAHTQAQAWERLVAKYHLRPLTLAQFLGQSHYYLNLLLGNASPRPAPPALVSTIKIRNAGFSDCMDTDASAVHWIRTLQERRWLPRGAGPSQRRLAAHIH